MFCVVFFLTTTSEMKLFTHKKHSFSEQWRRRSRRVTIWVHAMRSLLHVACMCAYLSLSRACQLLTRYIHRYTCISNVSMLVSILSLSSMSPHLNTAPSKTTSKRANTHARKQVLYSVCMCMCTSCRYTHMHISLFVCWFC